MRNSYDSASRPLGVSDTHYQDASSPGYGSGYNYGGDDGYYSGAQPYPNVVRSKKSGMSPWIKWGIPLAVVVVAAAVVGVVLAKRHHSNDASTSSNGPNSGGTGSNKAAIGMFPTGTDTYLLPIYPSTTDNSLFIQPTFQPASNTKQGWPDDPFKPATPAPTNLRPDRPRLIAPKYKWDALPQLIAQDPYLQKWNASIFQNATDLLNVGPVEHKFDGGPTGSGILDPARMAKERIKVFAYVYRMTNATVWLDRAWKELLNASGNGTQPFGDAGNEWNTGHFLDVAEFTAAFAIGYDWLYDAWTPQQRTALMWSILVNGLQKGIQAYTDPTTTFGWWRTVNGNWNCVCNNGLTMGALAVLEDDPTGWASQLLGLTIPNAEQNCAQGPSTDGTWSETPNYWYFGTTGHAEMASSLLTATGSTYNLLSANPSFNLTGLYHIYVTGMTSLFNYGDHGPNKYSTTANSMIFYGEQYDTPLYTLFQRDRYDSSEPWSMFWYDPTVAGAWWDNLPLDHVFDNGLDQWASMRSSWTDNNGTYVAMKSGNHTGHQTHGDLDAGDFVIDALGQRWAGELGSGDYLSLNYFSNETQGSDRWKYYRKMTEGQNCLLVDGANQDVSALPTINFGSSGDSQGSSTVLDLSSTSTAFFTTDLTTTYFGAALQRGIRFINGRKQFLLQDDINNVQSTMQWRMHTNATVAIDPSGASATLTLGGQTMIVQILNPPAGVTFSKGDAVRSATDPPLPPGQVDQPNPGVTVLMINLSAGTYSLQVLFNPQWPGMDASAYQTPNSVPIGQWSVSSHNPS